MLSDLRIAFRLLCKCPGYASATILILALGIGGVTALFSTLYAVMIQPLPYPNPDRLVLARATFNGGINPYVSGADYADYRDQNRSFSDLELYGSPYEATVSCNKDAERANVLVVSTGFFRVLGVDMAQGRSFSAEDGKADAPPAVIVSHSYWRKQFGSGTRLEGQTLQIDGSTCTVAGVAPPDFHFIKDAEIWRPLAQNRLGPRRFHNWIGLGRLREGASLAGAQSDIDVISARLQKAYPTTNYNKALLLTALQSGLTESHRPGLAMLCGATAAILLIACANAAGLLLARVSSRHGELAVRAALGASRWQIMRLLLCESLILSFAAGATGTVLALFVQKGLQSLLPVEALLFRDRGLSVPVLLFVLVTTLVTGVGFGFLPALRSLSVNLSQDLKLSGRGASRQGTRLRSCLVTGQVAVSFILLVVAGLLARSLTALQRADTGFDPHNLLTVEIPLPPQEYKGPQRLHFFESLLERTHALPGVVSASAITQLPLRNPGNNISLHAAGRPPATPAEELSGNQRVVLPGYFRTMGIPIVSGRDIQVSDTPDSVRVVLISQVLAEHLFPDGGALGRQIVIDGVAGTPWEVVGIVGDVKADHIRREKGERGAFYRPYAQLPVPTMRVAIRTRGAPQTIVAPLRTLLSGMDPNIPLSGPRTMDEIIANATAPDRAQSSLLTIFSLLALMLAAVGIYGLLAYSVAQGRRDIGIRMALGASLTSVAWSIVRRASLLVLAGLCIGGIGAVGTTSLIRSSLYGIPPGDPLAFALAGLALLLVAALAAWLPARRALRINPIQALRAE